MKVKELQAELDEQAAFQAQKEKQSDERIAAEKAQVKFEKAEVEFRTSLLNERSKNIESDKLQNVENARHNKEVEAINEKNAKEIAEKIDDFTSKEAKYKLYTSLVNENQQIKINTTAIGNQLKTDLLNVDGSWQQKVDYAVSNFTERCQMIITKHYDAILGFKTFLQGKTAQDFRHLADDMDRNGTRTYEEYETKRANENLDWQITARQQKMQKKSIRRSMDIER